MVRMRTLLAVFVAALPIAVAADDTPRQPPKNAQTAPRPAESNPCAIYGAGFVRLPGTTTCIKIGGGVTVDVGGMR